MPAYKVDWDDYNKYKAQGGIFKDYKNKEHLPLKRYINMWAKDLGPRKAKLYNLKDDPGETTDLSEQYPDRLEQMLDMAKMAKNWIGDIDKSTLNSRPSGFIEKPVPIIIKK